MKFCPVVPEICRGQVHGPQKERKRRIIIARYDYNPTIMKSPKPPPLNPSKYDFDPLYHKAENFRTN